LYLRGAEEFAELIGGGEAGFQFAGDKFFTKVFEAAHNPTAA
jgi:hypothetical protein